MNTRNGDRGTRNGDRGTRDGDRGTRDGDSGTRNGDSGSKRRRSLVSLGTSSDGKKKSGKKMEKKPSEKDETSSVRSTARTTRSRSLIGHEQSRTPIKDLPRNRVNENSSREPSQEPVKRKRGRPPKNSNISNVSNISNISNVSPAKRGRRKRKVVSKYFQDKSSDEEEEKSNYDESKNVKKTNRKKESPVEELIRIKSINNNETSSNLPSRRSSRVSSTASSALSSVLSVKNVSKKTKIVEKLAKVNEKKFMNRKSEKKLSTKKLNKKLNGNHSVEESEDEYQPEESGSEEENESEEEEEEMVQVAAFSKRKSAKNQNQTIPTRSINSNSTHNQTIPTSRVKFHGYHRQVSLLRSLIRSAVDQVESNTVLVVGSSGVGKSALIDHCLESEGALIHHCLESESTSMDHCLESESTSMDHCLESESAVTVLRLNGFVQSDESLALKSLNSQLDKRAMGTCSIPAVMDLLVQEDSVDKNPFVILVDKFDTFCRKDQYLIYNLFDCTRRCKHILVIGTTNRIDVQELLEKRVKSRMNQIMIHLASPFQHFDDYLSFAKATLQSSRGSLAKDSFPEEWIPSLKQLYSRTQSVRELRKFILQRNFSLTRSLPSTQSCLSSTQSSLPSTQNSQSSEEKNEDGSGSTSHCLTSQSTSHCLTSQSTSHYLTSLSTSHYLTSLSYLELAILVSVFKRRKSRETLTTGSVMRLASFLPSQMVHDRSMLFKVINNLIDYGFFHLITPINGKTASYMNGKTASYMNGKTASCMNENTRLGICVEEMALKSTLVSIQNSIPSNLKNILTL